MTALRQVSDRISDLAGVRAAAVERAARSWRDDAYRNLHDTHLIALAKADSVLEKQIAQLDKAIDDALQRL